MKRKGNERLNVDKKVQERMRSTNENYATLDSVSKVMKTMNASMRL